MYTEPVGTHLLAKHTREGRQRPIGYSLVHEVVDDIGEAEEDADRVNETQRRHLGRSRPHELAMTRARREKGEHTRRKQSTWLSTARESREQEKREQTTSDFCCHTSAHLCAALPCRLLVGAGYCRVLFLPRHYYSSV